MEVPKGLRAACRKATEVIPLPSKKACGIFVHQREFRTMTQKEFVKKGYSSGTAKKNGIVGMNTNSQVMKEMVAFVFGYHFELAPERMVNWGEAVSEGDCHPITEVGWHAVRYAAMQLFPGDEIEVKYITVERPGEPPRAGVGIIYRTTSVQWVPPGHCIFCIIAEVDPKTHQYLPAVVP